MLGENEYLLKADNYAFAAQTAPTLDLQLRFIRAAAICRNKALRVRVGKQACVFRRCPFTPEQLRAADCTAA
jgi:hypothetical protein